MKVFDVLLAMVVALIREFNFVVIEAGLAMVVLRVKHSNSGCQGDLEEGPVELHTPYIKGEKNAKIE